MFAISSILMVLSTLTFRKPRNTLGLRHQIPTDHSRNFALVNSKY